MGPSHIARVDYGGITREGFYLEFMYPLIVLVAGVLLDGGQGLLAGGLCNLHGRVEVVV